MKLSINDIKSQIKDLRLPVKETEDTAKEMYETLVSFFENRINEVENKIEDVGIVKKKTSATGIILGTLGGLIVGALATLKSPYDDFSDIPNPVKNIRKPIKQTGQKVNSLYHNALSFFGDTVDNVEHKMKDVGLIEKKNTGPGIFLGLLAGLAVGGAAALLLAQNSGDEFRNKISEKYEKTKDQLLSKKEESLKFAKNEAENITNAATAQNKDFSTNF